MTYLAVESPDYSAILESINEKLAQSFDTLQSVHQTSELTVGILSGLCCFLGIVFGFLFIKFLYEQIRR